MSNKTVPTITFTLPYDFNSQTPYYLTSSEISPNPYDSYLDCGLQELPLGKGSIADTPPTLDLNYGYSLFPSSNWPFQPMDSIGYSDFQGSLGGSDSFSTSPNSSNPNSPSSSIHSELSDTSPRPMWDQSLFMARNPPSPYALHSIETGYLRGPLAAADLNKRKRSLDDVYQPMLQYLPDTGQGEHAINELFANGVVSLDPYEFQSDNSLSSDMFPFSMANQTMTPMMNVFNTFVPPLPSPTVRSSSLPPNSSNAAILTANNGTTTSTSKTSTTISSKSSSTVAGKAGKKGRRLSNSSKSKSGITTIKKEIITPTNSMSNTGCNNCDSSCGFGTTDKRSLQQLRDVITTIDPTMKGGLVDGLNYLAQLAKNGPNKDISRSDIPTEMLKISMANSVMGMLYPPSSTVLPPNNSQSPIPSSAPVSSRKQSVELSQPAVAIGNNGQSYTITSTPCSYNGTYLNCATSPFIKEEPLYEEPPTNKRKKARSNQSSTQAYKASQQSFRFSVINSVNPKQQPQRLPIQQAATSMVTVL